jgi:Zn2+/Cd2+-exporting ATPase
LSAGSQPTPCPGCEGEITQVFEVEGLDCATEVTQIEDRLGALPGVCSVRASALTRRATVVHTLERGAVEQAFLRAGFRVRESRPAAGPPAAAWHTLVALGLTAFGLALSPRWPAAGVALYLPAILLGGAPIAVRGWRRLRTGAVDMNTLMTVAVLGAAAIGEWGEGATTVVLFSLAQLLEARSMERARRAVSRLMSVAPDTALFHGPAGEEEVPVAALRRGDLVVVGPGQRVPIDGRVEEGVSSVDQSPLTGESWPVSRRPGEEVLAGSINGSGALHVRVMRPAAESTLSRLLRRIEEAQSSRAASQGFVDAFARVYTPAVIALAALTAAVPPLVFGAGFPEWLYRALVLLVIACPCALVISTPISIVSALTAASRRGVLVKGGAHLEQLGRLKGLVFDKTGTLTCGRPEVTDLVPASGSARSVLALAAAVERRSAHPLAEAVLARARAEGLSVEPAAGVAEIPGRGVRGRLDGREVLVGSHRLFEERGLCDHRLDADLVRLESEGKTAVLVGWEVPVPAPAGPGEEPGSPAGTRGGLEGALAVADALRPEAAAAIAALHAQGLSVGLLTGDNARTTKAIADRLGIDERWSDLLPEDKVARLRELQARRGPLGMVGDGVNDAPALATAAVGIAMGGRGADVTLETADVVLMSGDLTRLPEAIRLGRRTRRVIRQNVALSLGVKGLVLVLALLGLGTLWSAVAADMGASLLVIGNGLRLLRAARPGE